MSSQPVVVITGASSGNGRAIAHKFAESGASVILVARDAAALAETAAECAARGGTALPIAADVGDYSAVASVGAQTIDAFGRIDIWINCAGIIHFGRIEDTPPEIIEQVLRTNVLGYFNGAQVAIGQFRQQGTGTLINISSVLAIIGQPYASAYVASKAAIRGMNESLRQEVADMPGIHICSVLPFAIDTPIYQRAPNYSGKLPQPIVPRYSAETVAETVLHLARHPRREVYAGKLGAFTALAKRLFPRTSDVFARTAIHQIELVRDGGAPSAGNAFVPVHDDGWTVSGGWGQAHKSRLLTPALLGLGAVAVVIAARRFARR